MAGSAGVERWAEQPVYYSSGEGDEEEMSKVELEEPEETEKEKVAKEVRSILEAAWSAVDGKDRGDKAFFESMVLDLLVYHIEDLSLFESVYHAGDAAWISGQLIPLGRALLAKGGQIHEAHRKLITLMRRWPATSKAEGQHLEATSQLKST